ncbi:MAG: hypothetical protein V2A62_00175 [Candidatus Woesearchaeota archaeon]
MDLQTILAEMLPEGRLTFLRQAYRPERQDVAEAILKELEPKLRNGSDFYKSSERAEFNGIIATQIRQAEEFKDTERVKRLQFQQITSYFYANDIESAAKSNGNIELVEKVIENYRAQYFNKAEMVISLLEHLGRKDEAREYSLEAAQALRKTGSGYTASNIYLRLGMSKEAIEVRLDNNDFDEAIKLAQEHLSEEELPPFYRRVFKAAKGKGYENGFPVQVKIAKLLKNKKLERTTKKEYVDWIMTKREAGYLDLIREVGTKKQLRDMHEIIVAFYQLDKRKPESLAKAAEEAYNDTAEKKYATLASGAYEKYGNFPKALEFARISNPQRIPFLAQAAELVAS